VEELRDRLEREGHIDADVLAAARALAAVIEDTDDGDAARCVATAALFRVQAAWYERIGQTHVASDL